LHGDPGAAKAPPSGGGLDSAETVLRLLREAGFTELGVETVPREWRMAHPGDLIAVFRRGTVRTAALIEAQRPAGVAGDRGRDRAPRRRLSPRRLVLHPDRRDPRARRQAAVTHLDRVIA
jgi:hypothetical protein